MHIACVMQAATVSLLRIFTDGGRTLCSVPEGSPSLDTSNPARSMRKANSAVAPGAVAAAQRPGQQQRRSLDSACNQAQAAAVQPRMSLDIAGRAYSLGLF